MKIIKGIKIAENILKNIEEKIKSRARKPSLAVIFVGNNNASQIYVGLKEKASRRVGIDFQKILFNKNEEENSILKKIKDLNLNEKVDGIIVQLPLPKNLNKEKIINTISIKKDVDGFHQKNQNLFLENKKSVFPVFPKAIIRMIEYTLEKNKEKNLKAVVICKSFDFGIIMKKALEKIDLNTELVFCEDLQENSEKDRYAHLILKRADVVITACGVLNLVNNKMVKNDAVIIDGGIIKKDDKVFGDVDMDSFSKTNCNISPVPGGVGPVTVATLLENVYLASKDK